MKNLIFFLLYFIQFEFIYGGHLISVEVTTIGISQKVEQGKYFATNVKINGHLVEGKFLIDTGSETIIVADRARKAGVYIRKRKEITDGFEIASVAAGKADFTIDNIDFSGVRVNVIEDYDLGIGRFDSVVGIIGHNLMENCGWKFTSDSVMIIPDIKRSDTFSGFCCTKLDLQAGSIPYIVLTFGRPRFTCLLDTGDDGFVQISELLKDYVSPAVIRRGQGRAVNMLFSDQNADNASVYEIIKTDEMEIAGCKIKKPVAYIASNKEGGALGSQLFNYFETVLDFQNKRIFLKPLEDKYDSEEWEIFGFSIDVTPGGVFVQFVWENSPAWEAGIRPGDQLLTINSCDYQSLDSVSSPAVYAGFKDEREKEVMEITLKHGTSEPRHIILQKRQLF